VAQAARLEQSQLAAEVSFLRARAHFCRGCLCGLAAPTGAVTVQVTKMRGSLRAVAAELKNLENYKPPAGVRRDSDHGSSTARC
jgi:hypothetical protein